MRKKRFNSKELSRIRLILFDFDGVFTDNYVYINQKGEEMVRCLRSDGLGLERLKRIGVTPIVISAEKNPVVKMRCKKLNVSCFQGVKDKLACIKRIIKDKTLSRKEICYVGNDINDIDCLRFAKYSFVMKDAYPEILKYGKWVTEKKGGEGAVREICDIFYKYRRKG